MAQVASPASAPALKALNLYFFAFFGALGVYVPYFPLWLESKGLHGLEMSVVAALPPTLSVVAPLLIGRLADGGLCRRALLARLAAVSAVAMLLLGVASLVLEALPFWLVFAGVLGYAACRSSMILVADAIAMAAGGDYGRRRVWGSVGFLLVALLCGRLGAFSHWGWVPLVIGLALTIAGTALRWLPPSGQSPTTPSFGATPLLFRDRRFCLFLVVACLNGAANSSYDLCGSLLFRDLGADGTTTGALWALGVVAEIIVMWKAAPMLRRINPVLLFSFAALIASLRWAAMSALSSYEWAFLLQPLHAVSFGLMWMSALELLKQSVGEQRMGAAQGSFMAAQAVGSAGGMLAWGPLYQELGGAAVFRVAAVLALLAGCVLLLWGRRLVEKAAGSSAGHRLQPAP